MDELEAMSRSYRLASTATPDLRASFRKKILRTRKAMVFLHVHKSLGTWMCTNARANGATTPMQDIDCAEPGDMVWSAKTWDFFNENSCYERTYLVRSNNYTFHEIERWIDFRKEPYGDFCPSQLIYSIVIRDPVKRIQSQMAANRADFAQVSDWLQSGQAIPEPNGMLFMFSHVPYDNFYIRTLCGRDCYFLAPGQITREHLERAKAQLDQIDVVMIGEHFLTDLMQLEQAMGWHVQEQAAVQVHNTGCVPPLVDPNCTRFSLQKDETEFLRRQNALDYEFYHYARALAGRRNCAVLGLEAPCRVSMET